MIEFVYLVSAILFFGVANFRRKIIMKNVELTEAPFWESFGFLPLIILVFLTIPITLETNFLLMCAASAVLISGAVGFLYFSLNDGYVSIVTTITNLNTHMAAIVAFLVFAEPFSFRLLAGISLAAFVIILLTKSKTVKPGKWLGFSLISLVFFALKNLVDKNISTSYEPLAGIAVISLFSIIVYGIPFAIGKKKATNKSKFVLATNGFLISIAFASLFMAFSILPLSIAAPVMGMNLLVTVLLGSYFLKEKLDRRAWIAVVLAVISVWLLAG